MPLPPCATLFPYTTLFRSLPFTIGADLHGYNVRLKDGGRAYRGMFTGEGVDAIVPDEDRASPFERPYSLHHAMTELDRKSTRLNSSHLGISYAVFCLKKKK